MWRAVTDAVGPAARDALWDYPDLMPASSDIDDPAALVARLEARARGEEPVRDEMDDALARLLAGEEPGAPAAEGESDRPDPAAEGESEGESEGPAPEDESGEDDGSGAPDDHRPV